MNKEHGNALIYVIVIVVVVAVVFVGYKLLMHYQRVASVVSPVASQQPTNPTPMTTASPSTISVNSGLSNKTDTSNAQLDKDLQEVGGSVSKLDQDSNTTNQDVSKQSADNPPNL